MDQDHSFSILDDLHNHESTFSPHNQLEKTYKHTLDCQKTNHYTYEIQMNKFVIILLYEYELINHLRECKVPIKYNKIF
jgi:hypothetical protein